MRKGNLQIAKEKLRHYAEKHGRIQGLWVEEATFSIYGYILFDHPLGAKRCLRDKETMYAIKNVITS